MAAGAVVDGDDPHVVVNLRVLAATGLREADVQRLAARELALIRSRRQRYLGARPPVDLAGRTAIVVDDGIATGATVRAALQAVAARGPACTILAVPVAPPDTLARLAAEADDVVCLLAPRGFRAVGEYYRDFHQVSDAEVLSLLG